MQKYRAQKTAAGGMMFDSKKEARRWKELELMLKSGAIKDLKRQMRFGLIPAQRIDGKCVERACDYIADFVYMENGKLVVEDVKGMRTRDYIIKRKLMLHVYGIRIREV